MKIKSNVNSGFKIDGVLIVPGVGNYPLNYKKKHIAYQLGILKEEGKIEYNELIKVDRNQLPFSKDEEKKEVKNVTPRRAKKGRKAAKVTGKN